MPRKPNIETKIQNTLITTRSVIYAIPFDPEAARTALLEAQSSLSAVSKPQNVGLVFEALAGLASEAAMVATAYQNSVAKDLFSQMMTGYRSSIAEEQPTSKSKQLEQRNTSGGKGL